MDTKNPSGWRHVVVCRTADCGDQLTYKQCVIDACNTRQDVIGQQVKIQVTGCVSDLHVADARYHDDCRKIFISPRSVTAESRTMATEDLDPAITATIMTMKADMAIICNSSKVYDVYMKNTVVPLYLTDCLSPNCLRYCCGQKYCHPCTFFSNNTPFLPENC